MIPIRRVAGLFSKTVANCTRSTGVPLEGSRLLHGSRNDANRKARVDLAVAYRQMDRLGLSEGVCNHLTMVAPSITTDKDVMLVVGYGTHWSKVSASTLVGLDENNTVVEDLKGGQHADIAAVTIHSGIRNVRKDIKCIMHAHPPYATTLGNLNESRLLMIHQNMLRFYKGIAYDEDYAGWAECVTEGERLGKVLGKDNDILMMCNHGVITTGETVAAAFDKMYYLERAAMFQVMALSTNKELRFVPESICQPTYDLSKRELPKFFDAHFKGVTDVVVGATPDVLE